MTNTKRTSPYIGFNCINISFIIILHSFPHRNLKPKRLENTVGKGKMKEKETRKKKKLDNEGKKKGKE